MIKAAGREERMAQSSAGNQRMMHLEELIQLEYEKLHDFEQDLIIAASANQRFEVRQRIAKDILPNLRNHEIEYAQLLAATTAADKVPEAEAQKLLDQVSDAADSLQGKLSESPKEAAALQRLKEELSKPGVASAKLKLTLPIIPLIASYELTLETAGLMMTAWRGVKSAFVRASANPP
jgi:hypothetical protein